MVSDLTLRLVNVLKIRVWYRWIATEQTAEFFEMPSEPIDTDVCTQ